MAGTWTPISQEEAKERMKRDDGHLIVDVRHRDEYESGHIPGAILVVNEEIWDEMPENLPDLNQILLIYCRSGRRSKEAAEKLAQIGYTRIYEFGGILDWEGETVAGPEPGGKIQPASQTDPVTIVSQTPEALPTAGPSCTAQLTFPSFDGGGPEFTFITDEPEIIRWEAQRVYKDPNHGEKEGSPYDVVLTLYALKEGNATLTVQARSPIGENYDAAYYVSVDGALQMRVSEGVVSELEYINGSWQRVTDEAIQPIPVSLVMECGSLRFYAGLEDNPSARAFAEALEGGVLEMKMQDYGGFEKVGDLPFTLPRSDEDISAGPGDIILYQGNKITVYYGTNRWHFTRLAHIPDAAEKGLKEALGSGEVTLRFYIEWSE